MKNNKINYLIGDATNPITSPNLNVIIHISNNIGAWGAGFVLSLSKKWSEPERVYRATKGYTLGDVQIVPVEENVHVINMIAQSDVKYNYSLDSDDIPLKYWALIECLKKVNQHCIENDATLHLPRIGSGLAGGDWNKIETILEEIIEVPMYVYDLK
jgi:O-acetyl-ADP-ribose deacetylase (regulator of RNase III)